MKMNSENCRLCGLVRFKSGSKKEKLPPRDDRNKRYEYEKICDRKPPPKKYNNSLKTSSSCESLLKKSDYSTSHTRFLRRRPKSLGLSEPEKIWPPLGYDESQNLSPAKAKALICSGAPLFFGHKLPTSLFGKESYHLFATILVDGIQHSDGREDITLEAASFRLQGSGLSKYPWETLEQPSMAFKYGPRPGTIRLNHWANMKSRPDRSAKEFSLDAKPRDLTIKNIIDRLLDFDMSIEYNRNILGNDPHNNFSRISELIVCPQNTFDFQIHDLVKALSQKSWIDFSKKKNQIVGKFFINATYSDEGLHKIFFHQLLLGLELDLRIRSYSEEAKIELLKHLPDKVKWDIALSKIWRRNLRIKDYKAGGPNDRIRFQLCKKKEQLAKLHEFAKTLKWPTLSSLTPIFSGSSEELENYSPDLMSYLTGVILPGPTLPYLLMNTLIDIDPSSSSNLSKLKHQFPNIGFQYRGSTYWTSNSIAGKVLAPTCKEIGGWIGPARTAIGLDRTQVALIRQRKPKRRLEEEDVESMSERSLPLGPIAEKYPVKDYFILTSNVNLDLITDDIRIAKLSLSPLSTSTKINKINPATFDASLYFAFKGTSWPLMLKYDVMFINASSCKNGPHPLFYDYEHKVVQVSDILEINNWAEEPSNFTNFNQKIHTGSAIERIILDTVGSQMTVSQTFSANSTSTGKYDEKILVIEAYGVNDNEVLARAWCSHWGLNALISDISKTCKACAIRESFAACINVLILIDSSLIFNEENVLY
ncbi:putative vtc domain-containing protein [Erysiphe necator]|uniref:Putative vtc domain-containing protein n=1 Tax=Uncinula necator TaxID=52586 RepID=A0A0B1P1J4_UNCNE|nr:putative vtc domain-containing protein [Erysiphe necator]